MNLFINIFILFIIFSTFVSCFSYLQPQNPHHITFPISFIGAPQLGHLLVISLYLAIFDHIIVIYYLF
jgi:ABC-type xylose transport system permease subunit